LELLAKNPRDEDYERFLNALESSDRSLWAVAWQGLSAMSAQDPTREFSALAKLVAVCLTSNTSLPRAAILSRERSLAAAAQKPAPPSSERWEDWKAYFDATLAPERVAEFAVPAPKSDWISVVKSMESLAGDSQRGRAIYVAKCGQCHGGETALGPSLVGVARRFSRADLATTIFEPSKDISDRYRAVRVLTLDDEILTGLVIYNAADGVTLQAANGSILRVNQDNIQEKAYSSESIMPAGLLDDQTPQQVADLFAYLGSL
jgi:putative heme-binding domain-containing protein